MTEPNDARLQRLLGGDHLAELRKRLRQSFERAPLDHVVDRIRVTRLSAEEHAALASLTGRPQRYVKSLVIDVGRVDADLRRAGVAISLQDALEELDGPIVHLARHRLGLRNAWSAVIDQCTEPGLRAFLQTAEGRGLLKRLARQDTSAAAALCRRAEAVLGCLPAKGVTRSQLAATTLGDSHALDGGRSAATLVLAVWRRTDRPTPDEEERLTQRQDANSERVRDIWARAGVLVNELARPALFLNLSADPAAEQWRPGEPAYVSLRSLLRSPHKWNAADRKIYVCENPNLLAIAADRWGADCAPLICTDGMPGAAQRCLLSQLSRAGARLHYHGDFDWPGIKIGNHIVREHGAIPWRFGAEGYRAALQLASGLSLALSGKPVEASWDEALAPAMREQGIAIAEEAVAALLLQDLDNRAASKRLPHQV